MRQTYGELILNRTSTPPSEMARMAPAPSSNLMIQTKQFFNKNKLIANESQINL